MARPPFSLLRKSNEVRIVSVVRPNQIPCTARGSGFFEWRAMFNAVSNMHTTSNAPFLGQLDKVGHWARAIRSSWFVQEVLGLGSLVIYGR
eukprot:scaffold170082_cov79-Cyclotella_meneghiniana.AAC.1